MDGCSGCPMRWSTHESVTNECVRTSQDDQYVPRYACVVLLRNERQLAVSLGHTWLNMHAQTMRVAEQTWIPHKLCSIVEDKPHRRYDEQQSGTKNVNDAWVLKTCGSMSMNTALLTSDIKTFQIWISNDRRGHITFNSTQHASTRGDHWLDKLRTR